MKVRKRAKISTEVFTPTKARVSVLPETEVQVHSKLNTIWNHSKYSDRNTEKLPKRKKQISECENIILKRQKKRELTTIENYYDRSKGANMKKKEENMAEKEEKENCRINAKQLDKKVNNLKVKRVSYSKNISLKKNESDGELGDKASEVLNTKICRNELSEESPHEAIKKGREIKNKVSVLSLVRKPVNIVYCEGRKFNLKNIAKDGKCCFNAITEGLCEDIEGYFSKLKELISEIKDPTISRRDLAEEITFQSWGGYSIIKFFCNQNKLAVCVHGPTGRRIIKITPVSGYTSRTIHVIYNSNHYVYLEYDCERGKPDFKTTRKF